MKISLFFDANDIDLVEEITSALDTNNILYERVERGHLRESEGETAALIAYLIKISEPHIIPALQYIKSIIVDHIRSHKHHPIEIHYGKRTIKVSRPQDLNAAISAIQKMTKLK